jgi:putative chitinase
MPTINRPFFFDQCKIRLFGGSLGLKQVEGLTMILDRWEASHAADDDRWLAYMLATAHHEVDRKMQPIKEYGGKTYFMKMYDVSGNRPTLSRSMGNTAIGDGARYFGRGFVQLTWKNNYRKAGDKIGIDLVANPDRALELGSATDILFAGMIEGWFTGKKLLQYFNPAKEDWVNARRIINGLDKANLISDYAKRYYGAISYRR